MRRWGSGLLLVVTICGASGPAGDRADSSLAGIRWQQLDAAVCRSGTVLPAALLEFAQSLLWHGQRVPATLEWLPAESGQELVGMELQLLDVGLTARARLTRVHDRTEFLLRASAPTRDPRYLELFCHVEVNQRRGFGPQYYLELFLQPTAVSLARSDTLPAGIRFQSEWLSQEDMTHWLTQWEWLSEDRRPATHRSVEQTRIDHDPALDSAWQSCREAAGALFVEVAEGLVHAAS